MTELIEFGSAAAPWLLGYSIGALIMSFKRVHQTQIDKWVPDFHVYIAILSGAWLWTF